jgi:hypothetical protein
MSEEQKAKLKEVRAAKKAEREAAAKVWVDKFFKVGPLSTTMDEVVKIEAKYNPY